MIGLLIFIIFLKIVLKILPVGLTKYNILLYDSHAELFLVYNFIRSYFR